MQLNELDKKAIIELKDEIAALEQRAKEVATIRADTPLEVILEQTSYKDIWDDGYTEGEAQVREILVEQDRDGAPLEGKKLVYSQVLESGKRYIMKGGVISIIGLKIMEGEGLFEFSFLRNGQPRTLWTFTAVPAERYVLFNLAVIFLGDAWFEVKAIEGHIRFVCAMSTFLQPEIEEVM